MSSSDSDSQLEDEYDSDDSVADLTEMLRLQEKEFNIGKDAVEILKKLPGVSEADIRKWLYMARTVLPNDEMYDHIRTYINNSLNHEFGIKLQNIVRLVRINSKEFEHIPKMKNRFRMLLWHGTETQYVAAILQNGFQIPPDKKQMFGTGIYFADRASKSANYCKNTRPGVTGYMFLCDVMLGMTYNAKNAKNEFKNPPTIKNARGTQTKYDSVKCTGENIPDREEQVEFSGCIIPCGKSVKNTKFPSYTIRYNEFIVYNPDHVRPKYLVKFEFTAKNS